jgi:hypothetical protein
MGRCGLAVLLAVLAGCSSATGLYPVAGKVLGEDGQPAAGLTGGLVVFSSGELRASATGEIGADGSFRLTTERRHDGAKPGRYEVTVTPPSSGGAGEGERPGGKPKPSFTYRCLPPSATVEPKRNEFSLTVRQVGVAGPGL